MADDTSLPHPTPASPTPEPYAPKVAEINAEAERKRQDDAVAARQDALKHSPTKTYDPAGVKTDEPVKPGLFSKTADTKTDTAVAKLRAFEDKHLGRRAMRNNAGHVEKGYGSPFKEMSPEKHAEHAALEKLVEAEARVDAANVDLSTAKAAVEVAKKAADEATKAADAAAVEAKRDADEDARAEKPVEQKSIDPSPGYAPAPAPRLDAFGKPTDPAQKGL